MRGGLYDMLGNVWEFVEGWYVATGPTGPRQYRVWLGGSWFDGPRRARASSRHFLAPQRREGYIGFRCAGE